MARVRAAIITDIHYGYDVGRRLGSKGPKLIEHFVDAVNRYAPDFVVDMGDRVSSKDPATDRGFMTELRQKFNRLSAPFHALIGNHDIKNLTRADNEEILGSPGNSYSHDYNGYHFVFWNPNVNNFTKQGLSLDNEDLEWLEADLAATDKPAVVFSHVPLDNLESDSTYSDDPEADQISNRFFYPEGPDARKILEDSGKVILCMSGHRHKKRQREINGIHYITQQSFTYAYGDTDRASRSYAYLELDEDRIRIQLRGHDRQRYDLTPRETATSAARKVQR